MDCPHFYHVLIKCGTSNKLKCGLVSLNYDLPPYRSAVFWISRDAFVSGNSSTVSCISQSGAPLELQTQLLQKWNNHMATDTTVPPVFIRPSRSGCLCPTQKSWSLALLNRGSSCYTTPPLFSICVCGLWGRGFFKLYSTYVIIQSSSTCWYQFFLPISLSSGWPLSICTGRLNAVFSLSDSHACTFFSSSSL